MRLWSGWFGAAIALPVLLIALLPALRNSVFRYDLGSDFVPDSLHLNYVEPESRGFDKSKLRHAHSVEDKIWHLVGVEPGEYFAGYYYDPSSAPGGTPLEPIFAVSPLKELAAVSKANPCNVLALVQTLMHANAADGRVAGPWENAWSYRYVSWRGASAPRPQSAMRPSDIQTALALAQRGQKLDPNNTFFDWMAARFLFAARRDEEAIQTLLRATHKTGFDLHFRELMPAGFERMGNAPAPLAEEKWSLFVGQMGIANAQWMDHVVNMALWSAMQREDGGDVRGAIDIEGALQHLCGVSADKSLRDDDKRLAYNQIARIWMAPKRMASARALQWNRRQSSILQSREDVLRTTAFDFRNSVKSVGRNAIAQETMALLPRVLEDAKPSSGLRNLVGTAFLRSQGESGVTQVMLAWTGVQIAWWQGWLALVLAIGFAVLGPWFPPRDQPVPEYSPRLFLVSMLGSALLTCGAGLICCLYHLQARHGYSWRLPDDMRFPLFALADYMVVLLVLAILGSILSGAVGCIWWTTRLKKTMPPLPPEPLPYPRHVGAHAEVERFHIWFWASVKFFWFRMLPILCPLLFLICGIMTLQLKLPLGIHGEWLDINTPLTIENEYLGSFLVASVLLEILYLLILPIRWRFFMPRFQRPATYAGFFAYRRILGWAVPLSLWIMLASLVFGCVARRQFDGQIDAFLRAEGSGVSSPK